MVTLAVAGAHRGAHGRGGGAGRELGAHRFGLSLGGGAGETGRPRGCSRGSNVLEGWPPLGLAGGGGCDFTGDTVLEVHRTCVYAALPTGDNADDGEGCHVYVSFVVLGAFGRLEGYHIEAGNLASEVLAAVFGRDVRPTGVLFIETDAPLLDGEGWTGQLVSCAGCGEARRCATAVR